MRTNGMKVFIAALLALAMCLGAALAEGGEDDAAIIDAVVENFGLLAAVPRQSQHEQQISDFLAGWAAEQGAKNVEQDAVYNLIYDLDATPGYEDMPLVVLQGHMDMVCVAAEGVAYDPLTDPIKVIRDDAAGTLTADGTSLGGDDGAGVAIIMAVTEGRMAHGPLRIIITVDEELGMTGIFNLDAKYVQGVQYLINIDSEASDEVLLSTAAGVDVMVSDGVTTQAPAGDAALTLQIKGLKGGHSGVEIDKGRLNATVGMARLLQRLSDEGIAWELASLEGGTASNAIPAGAKATIVVSGDAEAVSAVADAFRSELEQQYAGIESGIDIVVADAPLPEQVLSDADAQSALKYVTEIIDGVHTMSEYIDGLVESSSNLGLFAINAEGVSSDAFIRSSDEGRLEEIVNQQLSVIEACGWAAETVKSTDAWPYNPNNALLPIVREVYRELNGEEIKEVFLHAGLECGTFSLMNPELNMVSIGPDLVDVHSPAETLYLNAIPKTWRLLEGILQRVA